jgi:hypothetical protein
LRATALVSIAFGSTGGRRSHAGFARGHFQQPRFALLLLLLFRGCVKAKTFRSACLRIRLRRCFWAPFFHSSNVFEVSVSITDSASARGSPGANHECLEGMRVVGVYVRAVHEELEISYLLVDIAVLNSCSSTCHTVMLRGRVGVVLDLLEPRVHALRPSLNLSAVD